MGQDVDIAFEELIGDPSDHIVCLNDESEVKSKLFRILTVPDFFAEGADKCLPRLIILKIIALKEQVRTFSYLVFAVFFLKRLIHFSPRNL